MNNHWATPNEVKDLMTLREFAAHPQFGSGALQVHDHRECVVMYYTGTPFESRRHYPYGLVPGCLYDGYRHYVVARRKVLEAAR